MPINKIVCLIGFLKLWSIRIMISLILFKQYKVRSFVHLDHRGIVLDCRKESNRKKSNGKKVTGKKVTGKKVTGKKVTVGKYFPNTCILACPLLLSFLLLFFLLAYCFFFSCHFIHTATQMNLPFFLLLFSHLSTVTFFPVTFFPTWNCYFLSCFFFSHLSTVTFFPVTFFSCYFFSVHHCSQISQRDWVVMHELTINL